MSAQHGRAPRPEADETGPRRRTRQRGLVERALLAVDGFRSAQDVFADLRSAGEGVGLSTVYRQLKAMADGGVVDVVYTATGEAQYRLCGGDEGKAPTHHHHIVCRECGHSVEVQAPEVEAWAEQVAQAAGFTQVTHVVDVFGLCSKHGQ